MRVAINLLTEDPDNPSGAHWFWTRVIPEMAKRLDFGEELHLLVSPKSRHLHQGYGPNVFHITYPWSNERRTPRTLSEHLYSPLRLPVSRIDVFNTLMAPLVNISWSLVIHMKTMHAFTAPEAIGPLPRAYRRLNYPRTARAAKAIIINSHSLRSEIDRYLNVDPRKLKLIYEAVDHDLFKPGDAGAARAVVASHGVTKPFVLFVSSLWPYKNCEGLLRAWALDARVGDRLTSFFGGRAPFVSQCHHNCIMTKHPGYSSLTSWHQDIRYWSFERPDLISTWLALGQERQENGALMVIPGSHRLEIEPRRYDEALFLRTDLDENRTLIAQARMVELEPGDMLFFHCRLFHAAGRNSTDRLKCSLVFSYHDATNRAIPGTRSAAYPSIEVSVSAAK